MGKHSKPKPKGRGAAIVVSTAAGLTLTNPGLAFANDDGGPVDVPAPTPAPSRTVPAPAPQTNNDPVNWQPIIDCESGDRNIESFVPGSSASGYFQFIDSTWAHFGGREFAPRAIQASKAEQTAVANRAFRANGLRDWNASRRCWGDELDTINRPAANTPAPQPQPAVSAQTGNRVVDIAVELAGRGIQYRYGGKTPAAFDCSGFVSYVLNQAGQMTGYRTSAALRGWARPISASEARPGDLTFTPGHVAIYLGNGMIADAGNERTDVTVRRMWNAPNRTFGRPRGA